MAEFFDQWLADWDCHDTWEFSKAHLEVPVICGLMYVMVVFGTPLLLKKPIPMKPLFALWNLMMSAFSICGLSVALPYVYKTATTKGMHYMVCSDDLMWGGHKASSGAACYGSMGFFMTAFMLSKIPELGDTLFLVLQGKPVMFLHWYHHLSVMIASWYAYSTAIPTAPLFATMNYGVHSIMYFYFGVSQYTKALNVFRQPITCLQLVQMVFGMLFTAMSGYHHFTTGDCTKVYLTTHYYEWNMALYGSYFLLFAKLYYDNYVAKKKRKTK
eukprot:NODE_4728_length_1025_cov_122.586475_g4524_i0.p1 GENE.NODE_4728_length_1025_cov_122.586475_g4524_i0~~NODE_4728_length_1025_cov_122.586475_g4524_i0.p1  ORF type:complete len:271 (-),score=46.63 NODE_4728_length_1025_cov_122.586475_g4524_i0:157-969(-)